MSACMCVCVCARVYLSTGVIVVPKKGQTYPVQSFDIKEANHEL